MAAKNLNDAKQECSNDPFCLMFRDNCGTSQDAQFRSCNSASVVPIKDYVIYKKGNEKISDKIRFGSLYTKM